MELYKFYKELPEVLQCFAGDTPEEIKVHTGFPSGTAMRLVLEDIAVPGSATLTKSSTASSEENNRTVFTVQLTSADTAALSGNYRLHFVFSDADGKEYRKITGTLRVLPVPKED